MIVLDTHVVVWLAEAPELLSVAAAEAIRDERQGGVLVISDMTLLELARLISGKKLAVRTSMPAFLRHVEQNFKVLPVTGEIAERVMMFSSVYPKDPVDRVVGATALVHGCKLITKDKPIRQSGEVDCIW